MFNSKEIIGEMTCSIGALVQSGQLKVAAGTEPDMFDRIKDIEITASEFSQIKGMIEYVGVTEEFKNVINTFDVEWGITPAGFRREFVLGNKSLDVDLKRDISCMQNGVKRPTNVLYSANTANPFEVATMKDLIANLTTNPQIIYSGFLNNPNANVGGQFKDRFEVLEELKKLVGPGVDISVELNNPFAPENELWEEVARMEEVLSKYQLVVKVPHTGPINAENVGDFLSGSYGAYDKGPSKDFFYGHNLAYKLQEKGYRVNFTLMAEPHQTALALQAKPYFINAFVERRNVQTKGLKVLLGNLQDTGDSLYKEEIHNFMKKSDMLGSEDMDLDGALEKARFLVDYREGDLSGINDGLDSVRHSLRVLKNSNLPDTKLIVCNLKSQQMYVDLDRLVTEPEFEDMKQRVIITCEPDYFAQFTSSPTVYCYQRSFLTSVK